VETNNPDNNAKLIDVEKVFASKNPSLFKAIPAFIFRYLKRIIHQEEINEFLARQSHLKGQNLPNPSSTTYSEPATKPLGWRKFLRMVGFYLQATIRWEDWMALLFW